MHFLLSAFSFTAVNQFTAKVNPIANHLCILGLVTEIEMYNHDEPSHGVHAES